MKIAFLGGTGYLGSSIIHNLIFKGHNVLCIKRENSSIKRLVDIKKNLDFCDIDEVDEYFSANAPFDVFLNMACQYQKKSVSDFDIFEANLYNPLRIFLICLSHNINKYVTIGTGLPDSYNAYTISKAKYSEILRWYTQKKTDIGDKLSIYNIKLEFFYGPDDPNGRFIPDTIAKLKRNEKILLTEGMQIRDFIYIEDVIRELSKIVVEGEWIGYHDIPLGSGNGVAIRDLVIFLKDMLNSNSELCFGAIKDRCHEPDSVADRLLMNKYGIAIEYGWKQGMLKCCEKRR